MSRRVLLSYVGSGGYARPDVEADVVRETPTQITLRHPDLGAAPVKFSRSNGFPLGTTRTRGIGREGYRLPDAELKP